MSKIKFRDMLCFLEELNSQENRLLTQQIQKIAAKKKVSLTLETNYDSLSCPHCMRNEVCRWGKRNDMQRYRCNTCGKTFNSLTGTPLARLRRKGHWLDYSNCLKRGISIRKAAAECGISIDTAFRWRHRFLKNSTNIMASQLNGIVEVSETYFNRSYKGCKKINRVARKRGVTNVGSFQNDDKICVLNGRDRNHNESDYLLENFSSKNVSKLFKHKIGQDSLFCSENSTVYREIASANKLRHGYLDIIKGEFIKKDIVHLNNVIEYQNNFRFWILCHFKGVATKYLANYMAWFRELDEFGGSITSLTILLRAKSTGVYKYQPLIGTQQNPPPNITFLYPSTV